MKISDTPSLSILKSDASFLLRDARSSCLEAMLRLTRHGFNRVEDLTHDTCLRVIAEEYGTSYVQAVHEEKLISRYLQH